MTKPTLIIGNKNYSSWSMRPWVMLSAFNIPFTEKLESLNGNDIDERLGKYSKSQKVPVLLDCDISVWDSLAICEYVSEQYLNNTGWPLDIKQRAHARSISNEMHSSFYHLKNELPMNCRSNRTLDYSSKAKNDIDYIDQLWSYYYQKSKNQWLFDQFSIADCMFAPVASRFATYQIKLSKEAKIYQSNLLNHESITAWIKQAYLESEVVQVDETSTEAT